MKMEKIKSNNKVTQAERASEWSVSQLKQVVSHYVEVRRRVGEGALLFCSPS